MTWTKISIAAAVCGSVMIGYCIYFDRKRRMDPDFARKLRERRQNGKNAQNTNSTKRTRFDNHETLQRYFLEEIQRGEELLGEGKLDESVDHIANAVSVCGAPQQLLQVMAQTLPPQVYNLLVQRLPSKLEDQESVSDDADAEADAVLESFYGVQ